jgi:hypothetical protein
MELTETIANFFPRIVMLFVGIVLGIALFDTLKPARPQLSRVKARIAGRRRHS